LECTYDWSSILESHESCHIIYLDFKKAFDTVSHTKLLNKLKAYGISSMTLCWIKAFLSDRSQVVKVNSTILKPVAVASGTPQGSVLSTTLFVILSMIYVLTAFCK
jgi:hypothetical protein